LKLSHPEAAPAPALHTLAAGTNIPVEVRRLDRARRLRLSFRPERGFLLTCPTGTSKAAITVALEQAGPWLRRVWTRHRLEAAPELPQHLHLPAARGTWRVDYQARRNRLSADLLEISANSDPRRALAGLRALLRRLAKLIFLPRATQLAQQHGFVFTGLSCGLQRSRWGSCSSQGLIRLNSVLLFVEPALVDHVLLHELAHTRHLDHSPAFRRLMRELDADDEAHQRALGDAWRDLPTWWWHGGCLPSGPP